VPQSLLRRSLAVRLTLTRVADSLLRLDLNELSAVEVVEVECVESLDLGKAEGREYVDTKLVDDDLGVSAETVSESVSPASKIILKA